MVEQQDRFEVVMAKKSPLMLPSEPSNFCRYHFRMEIPMKVSVSNVIRRISYVSEYFVLKSLYVTMLLRLVQPHSWMS
jgi:hypothetical protein